MKISGCSLLVLLGLGGAGAAFGQDSGANKANGAVSYFRDIRPIIQRQCQGCHQPAVKQGGLDLTRYEGFKAGGNGGSAFEPGAPEKSLVLSYIKGERTPRMPFGLPPLAPEQIDLFSRWISADGSDDTPAEARETVATDKPPVYHLPPVITALAYSPDSATLAVSGYREILLHKADGSGLLARLLGISDRIQSLAFSPEWRRQHRPSA